MRRMSSGATAEEVLEYLQERIAAHRKGVSMRDARDLAVDDLLRKYAPLIEGSSTVYSPNNEDAVSFGGFGTLKP